jgi:hypothetical protein
MENGQIVNAVAPQLHIRVEGRSHDIPLAELDIGDRSTDEQIRAAAADHLGIPIGKLRAFAVDRDAATGELTMRPPAVFG